MKTTLNKELIKQIKENLVYVLIWYPMETNDELVAIFTTEFLCVQAMHELQEKHPEESYDYYAMELNSKHSSIFNQ